MSTPYVGEIRLFAFGRTPVGWEPCNGRLLEITEYDALFALIGTTYGGDGQRTFAVPDLQGRIPVHAGQGPGLSQYNIGQVGGAEKVTLLWTQIPSHNHSLSVSSVPASATTPGPSLQPGTVGGETFYCTDVSGASPLPMSPTSTTTSGYNQPHENCMPTLAAQFCIATMGIFPSQN